MNAALDFSYGNDPALSDYSSRADASLKSMKEHLRAGNLDGAFLMARLTQKRLDKLMERVNELKPKERLPDGYLTP